MNKPRYLIVQTAFLGDLLLSLPFFRHLSEVAEVQVVVRSGLGSLLASFEYISKVYEIKKGDRGSYKKVLEELKTQSIETVFCPHPSLRSAIFTWQIKAKQRVGYKNWWQSLFFTHSVKRPLSYPEPLRMGALLKALPDRIQWSLPQESFKLNQPDESGRLPKPPVSWAYPQKAEAALIKGRIAIFAGSQWGTKKWVPERFVKFGELLTQKGYDVYWLGSKLEREEIVNLIPRELQSKLLAGSLELPQLLQFLNTCELCISNDSGGGHLGAVAGCKVISIFGPTILGFGYRPWASDTWVIQELGLPCRPCGKHGPVTCPLVHHKCMKNISVERVLSVALEALS